MNKIKILAVLLVIICTAGLLTRWQYKEYISEDKIPHHSKSPNNLDHFEEDPFHDHSPPAKNDTFVLPKGVDAPTIGVQEGFLVKKGKRKKYKITVNVSAPQIEKTFLALASLLSEPYTFMLEVNRDVYLWKERRTKNIKKIVEDYGKLFFQDGHIRLALSSLSNQDILTVNQFKVFEIRTSKPEIFTRRLSRLGFERKKKLTTVEDNVKDGGPQWRMMINYSGKNIYLILDELKERGFVYSHESQD